MLLAFVVSLFSACLGLFGRLCAMLSICVFPVPCLSACVDHLFCPGMGVLQDANVTSLLFRSHSRLVLVTASHAPPLPCLQRHPEVTWSRLAFPRRAYDWPHGPPSGLGCCKPTSSIRAFSNDGLRSSTEIRDVGGRLQLMLQNCCKPLAALPTSNSACRYTVVFVLLNVIKAEGR